MILVNYGKIEETISENGIPGYDLLLFFSITGLTVAIFLASLYISRKKLFK
ncbi:MAG: hypothetical protein ACFE8E_04705 [Candidatus Hodarchaeota archaeon]